MDSGEKLKYYIETIENELSNYFCDSTVSHAKIYEAMKYSLTAPGKRIRPTLMLEFCRLCGGEVKNALPFACAAEMAHTYSLIHDDLPCMDDDDLRRGRPTNHKVFGEAAAVLAGDGLLTYAFELMLGRGVENVPADRAVKAAHTLSRAIGADGMVGGQILDIDYEGKDISEEMLIDVHLKKTGALIEAVSVMGCILGGGGEDQIAAAKAYARNIGLAFQIRDDMLDYEGDEAKLGKPVGSDFENEKSTFVTVYGPEKCESEVMKYTEAAIQGLKVFEDREFLIWLARRLANREK